MHQAYEKEFNEECDSYVIAYCPDTDEFFITKQRGFFWEDDTSYPTKLEAIRAFEENVQKYVSVKNDFFMHCMKSYKPDNKVWLDETEKWYFAT